MANLKNTNIDNNLELPSGTTGERPSSPEEGQIRYNTDLETVEFYNGENWRLLSDTHAEAEGGTVVDTDIGGVPYRIHYFTGTGTDTLTVTNPGEVEYLIVAGGGGGGDTSGGGGGAGGLVTGSTYASVSTYTITVGSGGLGSDSYSSGTSGDGGEIGGDSSAFGLTALGGGGGGSYSSSSLNRVDGGSGGGIRGNRAVNGTDGGSALQPTSASGGFGNDGGGTPGLSNGDPSSGGGGAGSPGEDCSNNPKKGGDGGQGIVSNITGSNLFYAGGGGGSGGYEGQGGGEERNGIGGIGGGGNGGRLSRFRDDPFVSNGSPNTGGGGGGNGYDGGTSPVQGGGNGGSGIVIVRYPRNSSLDTEPDRTVVATQPNRFSILNNRLVLHLNASKLSSYSGSGTLWKDISGRGNDATLVNGEKYEENRPYNFVFDGNNDHAVIQDTPVLKGGSNAEISVFCWAKRLGGTGSANLVEKQLDGSVGDWGLLINGSNEVEYYSEDGGNDYTLQGGSINQDEWHYFGFVLDQSNNNLRMYIDSEEVASDTSIGQISASTEGNVYLAARVYDNGNFLNNGNVAISEVHIYNKVLSQTEIDFNFDNTRQKHGI